MAYERTRQKLGFGPEVPDTVVLREGFAAAKRKRPQMTAGEYRSRLAAYEGAGAAAPPPSAPTPPTGAATAPPVTGAAPLTPFHAAREMVRDVSGLAQGLTTDPIAQMGRAVKERRLIVEPTPGEAERAKRGLAVLGGAAAGGVAGRVLPAASGVIGRLLRSSGIGASAGGADAALRTGDPAQAASGAVAGALLGPAVEGVAGLARRRAPVSGRPDLDRPVGLDLPALTKHRNPLRSVGERLKATGEEGQAIERLMREADTRAVTGAGRATLPMYRRGESPREDPLGRLFGLKRRGLRGLKDPEAMRVTDALEGRLDPDTLTPHERAQFDVFAAYRPTVPGRARAAGVRVRLRSGEKVPFPEKGRENFFPHHVPPSKRLRRGTSERRDILASVVGRGAFPSEEAATRALDDWIVFQESGGTRGGSVFAQHLIDSGQAANAAQARGLAERMMRRSRVDRSSSLEYAREADNPFYDPNAKRALPPYIENTERRLAEAEMFGPELERIDSALGRINNPEARETAADMVNIARRDPDEDRRLTRVLEGARRAMATKIGNPASALRNLSQSLNSALTSDATSFARGLLDAPRRAGRDLAIESGAVSESALRQVRHSVGDEGGAVSALLKVSGFSPAERVNRTIAANVGARYGERMARRLLKKPGDTFARSELRALEIDPFAILRQREFTHADRLRAAKVFSDRTQFRQREIDLPAYFNSSAIGRNVTQFKGFSFQQGSLLAKELKDRLTSGDPAQVRRGLRNVALLASAYPAAGIVLQRIRDWATGRPEGDDTPVEQWVSGLIFTGGLGPLTDISQGAQYDFTDYLAGPTVSTLGRTVQAGRKALPGKPDLNAADKRFLARQVPFAGPLVAPALFPNKDKNARPKGRPERPSDKARPERKEPKK